MDGKVLFGSGSLSELMEAMRGGGEDRASGVRDNYDCSLDTDVQIERLMEVKELVSETRKNGCKFKVGDLVCPDPTFSIRGPKVPHVVIDRLPDNEVTPVWTEEPGSSSNGKRMDIRIAVMVDNDTVATFWVESWQYRPYR